jgi:ketosteroid isomerase-like protein
MYRIGAATVIVLVTSLSVFAQSAESEVRKANDQLLAVAQAGDSAAYAKFLSDDLRWVGPEGVIQSKAQRLAAVAKRLEVPKSSEVDVKVYGETAVMLARIEFANGDRGRVHRVFVKRGGQWQLASHSGTPMK